MNDKSNEIGTGMGKTTEFADITEPFEFVYPKEEEIGGKIYEHIFEGIYQPQQRVEMSEEELNKLTQTYPDLVFMVEQKKTGVEIYFVSQCGGHFSYAVCLLNKIDSAPEFAGLQERIGEAYLEAECWTYTHWEEPEADSITGLCRFRKPDEKNMYHGYPKHIQMQNKIGYLIEPGIYYFGDCRFTLCDENLKMDLNQICDREMAGICYATDIHPSPEVEVTYLAVGKENFARLKEIQSTKEDSIMHIFRVSEDMKKTKAEIPAEEQPQEPEPGAVELLEGIGIKNICLGYHTVFEEQIPVRFYDFAYTLNGKLVLLETEAMYERGVTRQKRNEVDLRLIGELTVRTETELKCGLKMERDIKVIECKKEKEQELLSAEKLRFKDLRKYLSRIDRFSMCMLETMDYENYTYLENVPHDYDDFYVVGIGVIESEFPKDSPLELCTCMEIMLSEKPCEKRS